MDSSCKEKELLEKFQDQFRRADHVYITCMDKYGNPILSESNEETEFFSKFISKEMKKRLIDVSHRSCLESIVEETLEQPYIKYCALICRQKEKVAFLWTVTAIIEEFVPEGVKLPEDILQTSEKQFYEALTFLESLSHHFLQKKEEKEQLEQRLEQAEKIKNKQQEQMLRNQAMTNIVMRSVSDEKLQKIVAESVREVCQVLHIQGGCIIETDKEGKRAKVFCEYSTNKNLKLGQKISGKKLRQLPFWDGMSYMISSGCMMPAKIEKFFARYHVKAGIFLPIKTETSCIKYLCFYEFEKKRVWELEDITFINDVRRILSGVKN